MTQKLDITFLHSLCFRGNQRQKSNIPPSQVSMQVTQYEFEWLPLAQFHFRWGRKSKWRIRRNLVLFRWPLSSLITVMLNIAHTEWICWPIILEWYFVFDRLIHQTLTALQTSSLLWPFQALWCVLCISIYMLGLKLSMNWTTWCLYVQQKMLYIQLYAEYLMPW